MVDRASPVMIPLPGPRRPSARLVQIGAVAVAISTLFFAWDLVEDIYGASQSNAALPLHETVHMALELLSVAGMVTAVFVLNGYLRFLGEQKAAQDTTIALLRGRFHSATETLFSQWTLTPAERDVAMLILKGQSVQQIAALRNTAPGTIKAQSSAIFRKTGVTSKTELVCLVMDEFLDVAQSAPPAASPKQV